MGFIFDGLDSEDYDRHYDDRELIKRILGYFRPYSREMLLTAVMITLNSIATSGSPIVISKAIDVIADDPTTEAMLLMTGGVLVMGVAAWFFNYIRQYFSARVVGNVVLQLREDVFEATIRHDLSFYDEHPSGKIVSRVTSDTQDFAAAVSLSMNLLSQALLVVLLSAWLLNISLTLTLVMLGMTPVAFVIALRFRHVARQVTRSARRITAIINAQIQESVSGIIVAKSFRQEQAIYATFNNNNRQGYEVGLRRGFTFASLR
jgi:ATP-binding cassette subfamily B protein